MMNQNTILKLNENRKLKKRDFSDQNCRKNSWYSLWRADRPLLAFREIVLRS